MTMFDTARLWAYGQWWEHRHGTAEAWIRLVLQRCHAINTEFADPLPFVEVRATAHSVGKWIWRNFDEVAYRARQGEVGRKGGRVVSPAKIEANRQRRIKIDRTLALEVLR